MQVDQINRIADVIYRYVDKPYFSIQTNGVLLSKPEVHQLFFKLKNVGLCVGFDSNVKHPSKLDNWTKEYLKGNREVCYSYTIDGKDDISDLAENLDYIYETYGKYPTINYNFFKTDEIPQIHNKIKEQIMKSGYFYEDFENVSFGIQECGEIVLQSDGLFRACTSKVCRENNSIEEAQTYLEQKCEDCPYKLLCIACPVRLANYGIKNLCLFTHAIADGIKERV